MIKNSTKKERKTLLEKKEGFTLKHDQITILGIDQIQYPSFDRDVILFNNEKFKIVAKISMNFPKTLKKIQIKYGICYESSFDSKPCSILLELIFLKIERAKNVIVNVAADDPIAIIALF